jgi:uncharacterized protein YdeI (YjbR/CyaY-like superfamily)
MAKKDPRVDAYIAASAEFARPILKRIRKAVHAGCPDVEETLKWGFPHFMHRGIVCSMASFQAHCALGFWKHDLVVGKTGAVPKEAMGQFGRLTKLSDLPSDAALARMVKEAARLNEQGVKSPARAKRPLPTRAVTVPDYLRKAIAGNKQAHATFTAFSPSHKREYVEWVTEAKTKATRQRRLETAVAWMAERKPYNWKYVKK